MQIFINGSPVAVKSGISFEYVAENRLFDGGDDYTFAITLPLAGCAQNRAVFGYIDRADVVAGKIRYDCEIRCGSFIKFGTATVTEISEQNVKIQFLAGRSEQNFNDTWDKVYVNELNLGAYPVTDASQILPASAWNPSEREFSAVALPWCNNDSGIIHNCAEYADGVYSWSENTKSLSWQPYLLYLTKCICNAVGYSFDFSAWETHAQYKYLLVCNCLPSVWGLDDYSRALPHWTVDEYFEKLGLFLFGEFDIDHRAKKISFSFTADILEDRTSVHLDHIVDEHTVQIRDGESKCEYQEARNIIYKDCGMNMYKYYCCDELVRNRPADWFKSYDTLSSLIEDNKGLRTYLEGTFHRGSNYFEILYAKDVDVYFIIRAVDRRDNPNPNSVAKYQYRCVLQPVNLFGGRIIDESDHADPIEIEFIPAVIDFTEEKYGDVLFLQPSGYNESSDESSAGATDTGESFTKTPIQNSLESGVNDGSKAEYYSQVFVAFWDGSIDAGGKLPHPHVENIQVNGNWTAWRSLPFSLRINDPLSPRGKVIRRIDPKSKYTFRFLSYSMPDVRSVFYIRGKRYLCEKITATFSDHGMSQLMKGEFYPIVD